MKDFLPPKLEVVVLNSKDIITSSGGEDPTESTRPHGPETPGDDFS